MKIWSWYSYTAPLAKWFLCPHFRHSAPIAGHDCCLLCLPPHLSHVCLFIVSVWIVCKSIGSIRVLFALKDFICDVVASLALHMSIAFCSVRSASLSNLLRVLSQIIPQTIRSRINSSLRSPNSHVFALVLRSVIYWSKVRWLRVLNMCLCHVMFFHGIQYSSNFSSILSIQRTTKFKDWKVTIALNNQKTAFKIDTGAQCNVIPKCKYHQVSKMPLQKIHSQPSSLQGP